MWFATNAPLRTISAGARSNRAEALVVYDFPEGPVAIATVFRTKDWADREELAPYELGLERLGVALTLGEAFDDTIQADGVLLLRTRFVIGHPALAKRVELRDSEGSRSSWSIRSRSG